MDTSITETGNSTDRSKPSRQTSSLYLFMLFALTTFLVLLACWHSPSRTVTVAANANVRPAATSESDDKDRLAFISDRLSHVLSRKSVISAAREAELLNDVSSHSADFVYEELRRRLVVETRNSLDGNASLVTFQYTGTQPDPALRFVDRIVEAFVQSDNEIAEASVAQEIHRNVPQNRIDAEKRMHQERENLDKILANGIKELSNTRGAQSSLTKTNEGDSSVQRPNPVWLELNHRLTDATNRYQSLVRDRTDSHPSVARAKSQVEQLEAQLSTISRYRKDVVEDDSAEPTTDGTRLSRAELLAEVVASEPYKRQLSRFEAAERAFNVAMAKDQDAAARSIFKHTADRFRLTVEYPPTVVGRSSATLTVSRFAVLGVVSLVVGGLFSTLSRRAGQPRFFHSVGDVREMLGADVMASLVSKDLPAFTQNAVRPSRTFRFATHLAEVFLGLVLAILAVTALLNQSFSQFLMDDPYSAYSHAVAQAISWLG